MQAVPGAAVGEQKDQSLDLPPAAEMVDIADLAAAVGARRRLAGGMDAEARDQLGRFGRRRAVGKMDVAGQGFPRFFGGPPTYSRAIAKSPTAMLNAA